MAKNLLTRREVLSLQSVIPGLLCSSSSLWAPCPFTDLPWVILRFLSDIGFVAKTFLVPSMSSVMLQEVISIKKKYLKK